MKLNKEELLTGVAHSVVWCLFQGLFAIPALILSGLLWAFGGAEGTSKDWRRIGCPLVICLPILSKTWWAIPMAIAFHLILRIGYGIPSYLADGTCTDNGSWLGRLWWKLCGGRQYPEIAKERAATIGTRTTIAVLTVLAFLPLAWVNLIPYIVGGLLLTVLVPTIVDKT